MDVYRSLAIALALGQIVLVDASWGNIAGYAPGSKVSDHNAIDLDQIAIENALSQSPANYNLAKNIYQSGGNSKAYAEFSVPPLASALSKGDAVVGSGGGAGKMYADYPVDATTIRVTYLTSEVQAMYASCKVGALESAPAGTTPGATQPYQFLSGCFSGDLTITSSGGTVSTITPTGGPTNKAGRTLRGFSTKAGGLMYTKDIGCKDASNRATDGCPYRDFSMYYDYYGSFDYADVFVMAAITGGPTNFGKPSGNMDFTNQPDSLRKECIKKGTAYMNAYMYAIREFEDAIDDCKAGCDNGIVGGTQNGVNCNSMSTASVHAWDEGVAFYTGSREGVAAGGNLAGVLSYRLAEKRCKDFKTCGENYNSTSGTSYVNTELFRQLAIGAHKILLGQCEAARPALRKMVALMATPLIQGTLRYAYKVDKLSGGDKEKGEGAVFAAAVVPRVAACNANDAQTIMDNMKVGAISTSFAVVKAAFENNYACIGITCTQVGGLWFSAESRYYDGADPCNIQAVASITVSEKDTLPTWAIILIIVVSALALCLLVLSIFYMSRAKKYHRLLKGGNGPKADTVGAS